MASLYQLKSGKWRLDYTDIDGQRYQVGTATSDRKTAEIWRAKAEHLVSLAMAGVVDRVGRIGSDEVFGRRKEKRLRLSEFEKLHRERCLKESIISELTLDTHKNAFASFRLSQGNRYMHTYSSDHVRAWDEGMIKQCKSKTTRSIYGRALQAAYSRATLWKLTTENPFLEIKWPTARETRRKEHAPSPEEMAMLFSHIDKDPKERRFGIFVRLGINTGKRPTELLGVQGKDIDLESRVIVFSTLKRREGVVRSAVPMNESLFQVLSGVEIEDDEYLFKTNAKNRKYREEGRPWTRWWVTHHFKDLVIDAGLPSHYKLSSLRRAYVTYLRQQDVPPEAIRKLLGQASLDVWEEYDESSALDFRHHAEKMDFGDPAFADGEYRPGTAEQRE